MKYNFAAGLRINRDAAGLFVPRTSQLNCCELIKYLIAKPAER